MIIDFHNPKTESRRCIPILPITWYNVATMGSLLPKRSLTPDQFLHAIEGNKDQSPADLSDADLRGYSFQSSPNTNLPRTDFTGALLDRVSFNGLNLWDSKFDGASLREANFYAAGLAGCSFSGADIAGADFSSAHNLSAAQLLPARNWLLAKLPLDVQGALGLPEDHARRPAKDFRGYNLSGCNLAGCDLKDANLQQAKLEGASLSGADLEGANLAGARIQSAQVREARNWFLACYGDSPVRAELGLSPKHDEHVLARDFKNYEAPGSDLRDVDFSGLLMEGANLHEAHLEGARLAGTDLEKANLEGAFLSGANFDQTLLDEAKLQDADLRNADLSTAVDLTARQLLGADLTGAKLPSGVAEFKALETVAESSRNSRKLLVTVLIACFYSLLTILGVKHATLFGANATATLPILQNSIPLVWFFALAPALILSVYLYLHFSLQTLWDALASLPAVFTDGRPLHERAYPWLLNGVVRAHYPRLDCPLMARLQIYLSYLVAWWAVPATVAFFWWVFLVRKLWWLTAWHVVLIVVAVVAALQFLRITNDTLEGIPPSEKPFFRQPRSRACVIAGLLLSLLFAGISWLGFGGGTFSRAGLEDSDLSEKLPGWSPEKPDSLGSVRGAELIGVDLSNARAQRVFAARARFLQVNLAGAYVAGADLRQASFYGCSLTGASFRNADLRGAYFSGSSLDAADWTYANLQGTVFHNVTGLDSNRLRQAHNWILAGYDTASAQALGWPQDLIDRINRRRFTGAALVGVRLQSADLTSMDFRGADLSQAYLAYAKLVSTDFRRASLANAYLGGADLTGCDLRGADLRRAQALTVPQLKSARLDAATRLDPAFSELLPAK